jgi:hypothetical protein
LAKLQERVNKMYELVKIENDFKERSDTPSLETLREFKAPGMSEFSTIIDTLSSISKANAKNGKPETWVVCNDSILSNATCGSRVKNALKYETDSAIFMVHLICQSLKTYGIEVNLTVPETCTPMTSWDEVKGSVLLASNATSRRLIIAAGPSGCGKTYIADVVLDAMMHEAKFVCAVIDGALSRENSLTYQAITKFFLQSNVSGLSNLNRLFESKKKSVFQLLIQCKPSFQASLYVPDTLIRFGSTNIMNSSYGTPYLRYTDRKKHDTVLVIFQHLNESVETKCPFPEKFQCVGCDVSGRARAKFEGKKYSPSTWKQAKQYAEDLMKLAHIQLSIHNSGGFQYSSCNGTLERSLSIIMPQNAASVPLAQQMKIMKPGEFFIHYQLKLEDELKVNADCGINPSPTSVSLDDDPPEHGLPLDDEGQLLDGLSLDDDDEGQSLGGLSLDDEGESAHGASL